MNNPITMRQPQQRQYVGNIVVPASNWALIIFVVVLVSSSYNYV